MTRYRVDWIDDTTGRPLMDTVDARDKQEAERKFAARHGAAVEAIGISKYEG